MGFIALPVVNVGDEIVLPLGMPYVNEYYAEDFVVRRARTVRVTQVFREAGHDDFFWLEGAGAVQSCWARCADLAKAAA